MNRIRRQLEESLYLKTILVFLIISILPITVFTLVTYNVGMDERKTISGNMMELHDSIKDTTENSRQMQTLYAEAMKEDIEESINRLYEKRSGEDDIIRDLVDRGLVNESEMLHIQEEHEAMEGSLYVINYTAMRGVRDLEDNFQVTSALLDKSVDDAVLNYQMESQRSMDRIIRTFGGIFLGMVLIVGGISLNSARRIVGPVEDLQRGVMKVSQGDMDGVIETRSRDEIGTLAREFNRMVRERARTEKEIKRYNKDLLESNKFKDLFTDILSHDLKNSLFGAMLFAEHLKAHEMKGQGELDHIIKSLDKALELIDNASRLSRLESMDDIKFTDLDLQEVIKSVVEVQEPLAYQEGMEIVSEIERSLPIRADVIIEDVFHNLISNAIKYAPQGKRIEIIQVDRGECWDIGIRDHGDGIDDDIKQKIFERFTRGTKVGVKGTGMGLAIVKKIVEDIHQGMVWVEDNPGGGSIFYVRLPKEGPDLSDEDDPGSDEQGPRYLPGRDILSEEYHAQGNGHQGEGTHHRHHLRGLPAFNA